MKYRKLTGYKYELMEFVKYPIAISHLNAIETPFIRIYKDPKLRQFLVVRKHYAWDGSSWSSDKYAMKASLIHDALYQLMREGYLNHCRHRKYADQLYRSMCIAAGMSKFHANLRYWFLRRFGEGSATRRKTKQKIFEVEV